jgi:hypothetical protein
MALRPFARHPKSEEAEEIVPEEGDGIQFFSNDRRRREDNPVEEAEAGPESTATSPASMTKPAASATAPVATPSDSKTGSVSEEVTEGYGDPGWYPDASEQGLMRYWDGHHLTGQVLHVHARATDEGGRIEVPVPRANMKSAVRNPVEGDDAPESSEERPQELPQMSSPSFPTAFEPAATPEQSEASQGEDRVAPPALSLVGSAPSKSQDVPESPVDSAAPKPAVAAEAKAAIVVESKPAVVAEEKPVVVAKDQVVDEPILAQAKPAGIPPKATSVPSEQVSGQAGEEAKKWAKRAEEAVAKASTSGTPESWQEAARVSAVVSEMSQTLQAAAQAQFGAAQLVQAAREAAVRAQAAAKKSADAEKTVHQAERAAQEADDAAKLARRTAVDAKASAEAAAQVVPGLAEAQSKAAEAAADAERKAESLAQIVRNASETDTPVAWSEALKLTAAQVA